MSVAREIEQPRRDTADVVIVGAGAAGLAAAIFCARAAPEAPIQHPERPRFSQSSVYRFTRKKTANISQSAIAHVLCSTRC
jgi:2-polyprenyl-6-methoxyphenol hydroxylase-like FAD-dependent oxidoreductase